MCPARPCGSRCRPEAIPGAPKRMRKPELGGVQADRSAQDQIRPQRFDPRDQQRARRSQPGLDPIQAVTSRLYRLGSRAQRPAEDGLVLA